MTSAPNELDAGAERKAGAPAADVTALSGVETNTDPVTAGKLAALDWWISFGGAGESDTKHSTAAVELPSATSRDAAGRVG